MAEEKLAEVDLKDAGQDADALKRIERIDALVKTAARYRRLKNLSTGIGLLLILLAIAFFAFRIVDFVRNYDYKGLLAASEKQASFLADCKETRELLSMLQNSCLPEMREEIVKRFAAEAPSLRKELFAASDELKCYIAGPVKEKVMSSLFESVKKLERELLVKKRKFSLEEIDGIVKSGRELFIEDFTARLESRLDDVQDDLVALNAAFEKLSETPEYKEMQPSLAGEYESRVIESLLELCIYQMDPAKGSAPAKRDAKNDTPSKGATK
jgi:hypothetical protein